MATPLSLSIVNPAYSNLKKFSPILHFLAGLVFIAGAWYELNANNRITAICELIIGLDVIVLAFLKQIAEESTRLNASFRLIEVIVFGGLFALALLDSAWLTSFLFLTATVMYAYIFHCELKLIQHEKLAIHHLGVTISSFPKDKELDWEQIETIEALPHSITIQTRKQRKYRFDFQKAIVFAELEQIHEFCGYYLNAKS